MLFSQRMGLTAVMKNLQTNNIDGQLKNRLWNELKIHYWDQNRHDWLRESMLAKLFYEYWHSFYKLPLDEIPTTFSEALSQVRKRFFQAPWFRIYDFIEFTMNNFGYNTAYNFPRSCNKVL